MSAPAQGLPASPLTDSTGRVTPAWFSFFIALLARSGGSIPSGSASLDTITTSVGAMLFRGASVWEGLAATTRYKVLRMGIGLPEWDTLDGNKFGTQSPAQFFGGPASGAAAIPSFRQLVSSDLAPIAGQIPGVASSAAAPAGDVGEYISSQIALGSAVVFSTGVPGDITFITLTPGDWDVWANLTTAPDVTTTQSAISGWINTVTATDPTPPNGGAYAQLQHPIAAGLSQTLSLGSMTIQVPAATTQKVYLSANIAFALSTLGAYGFIGARRRR